MIRHQLIAALHVALDAAGFPAPPGGIELIPPKDTGHGDFATNVALQLAKPLGDAAARRSPPAWWSSSSGERPPHLDRIEIAGPGFLNLYLAPDLAPRGAAGGRRRPASGYGQGDALAGTADQPRVRLGQPHRPAACRRRSLGRGRRRDRQPAGGTGRGGAPRVLPERRREPARHLRGLAPWPGIGARSRPRTATRASTSSTWPTEMRAELGDEVTVDAGAGLGLPAASCARLQRRPRPHRRALRHLVLRADAARAPARRARSSTICAPAASSTSRTAPRGCAPPTSATRATACSVKSDGSTTYLCNDLAYHREQARPGLGAPGRHLGRRSPRPGEVAAGGRRSCSATRPVSPRSSSASS